MGLEISVQSRWFGKSKHNPTLYELLPSGMVKEHNCYTNDT